MNELMIVDKLRCYAALEVRRGESDADVVKTLLAALAAASKPCLGVETLGRYSIGGCNFVRFRSDVDLHPDLIPDRGHIVRVPDGFKAKLPSGKQGRVPQAPMFMLSMQRRVYHGTVQSNWHLQFA